MSAFGFDPEQIFARRRSRPRIVRPPGQLRRRIIIFSVLAAIVVLLVAARWLLGLRAEYLYYASLGHTNVFWTPLIAHIVLFFIGFAIVAVLFAGAVIGCAAAAANLDRRGRRIVLWSGLVIGILAGIAGGSTLSGEWQDILVWLHSVPFGSTDPVFHLDYSFFVFTLPAIDDFMGLLWGGVILGLLAAIAMAVVAITVMNAPEELPLPLDPPPGRTPESALRVAVITGGFALAGVFILAALGAHFGVYHLATSQHSTGPNGTGTPYVGLDATQRAVVQPVLGFLQVLALVLAVATVVLIILRWRRASTGTAIALGSMLGGWLLVAGLIQGIPAAVYQATSVGPNEQSAQTNTINDYLNTSRYAWAIQSTGSNPEVENRNFGTPHPPTLSDLESDLGTLQNVRIQDPTQLPDTLAQIDRTRSYQTYSTITVDRYPDPATGQDVEVMLGAREIAEGDLTNSSFVSSALDFTHGYGVTAVSVNAVGGEGKPEVLVGGEPMAQETAGAPPDLSFDGSTSADPADLLRVGHDPECGLRHHATGVQLSVRQPDQHGPRHHRRGRHPDHQPDRQAGDLARGFRWLQPLPQRRADVEQPCTREPPDQHQDHLAGAVPHRRLRSVHRGRPADGTPHVDRRRVRQDVELPRVVSAVDGTSYMRNAVKAVIDAKTCQIRLYAVNMNEPITAAWNAIYPGLLTPLSDMSSYLRSHLRYPEDYFNDQAQAYASVHQANAAVFFQGADLFNLAQETVNGTNQATTAYYVEVELPGTSSPQFVLLQTFSPGTNGSGNAANNMTAWLAAECDYTCTNQPALVSVRLNNADNVLGPLQFDNNINTNQTISSEISLLDQHGSTVTLGNVIVLPFNNDSFLYVRPLYVTAASSNGSSVPAAAGRDRRRPERRASRAPHSRRRCRTCSTTACRFRVCRARARAPVPVRQRRHRLRPERRRPRRRRAPAPPRRRRRHPTGTIQQQIIALDNKIVADNAAAEAALMAGNFTAYGADEAKVQADLSALQKLLAQQSPTPAP